MDHLANIAKMFTVICIIATAQCHLQRIRLDGGGLMGPGLFMPNTGGMWNSNGMIGGPLSPFWAQSNQWGPFGAQAWTGQTGWSNNGFNNGFDTNTFPAISTDGGMTQQNINDPWFAYRQLNAGLSGSGTLDQTVPGANGVFPNTNVAGIGLPGTMNGFNQQTPFNSFANPNTVNGVNGNFPIIPGNNFGNPAFSQQGFPLVQSQGLNTQWNGQPFNGQTFNGQSSFNGK